MGEVLRDRYVVLEVAGSGGEATVVRGLDRQHDRTVALKIRPASEGGREVLLAEARVLLSVPPHPNLPLVREDFFDDDRYVIAMDWVDGTDLASLLRREGRPGLPVPSVLRWLAEAAAALTHLHTQPRPVVHGDVKPANLILTSEGQLVLVDFGLASTGSAQGRGGGTEGYRAPEVTAGAPPSRASDTYGLAATAWALLTGSTPTGIPSDWEGIHPADARRLEEAVRSGLATDPARRTATPGELVERIRAGWSSSLPTGVLTFCLTDIEGSTARWAADPDAMARALIRHDDIIASVVQEHGGRLLKSMGEGDATVSVFTSAPNATTAAATIQQRFGTEDWPGERPLRVRIGVHTGEAERRGDDYFGVTLSVAARLRSLARAGEVLLSGASGALVYAALPEDWTLVDLGANRLAGIEDPVPVLALGAPGVITPQPMTASPYRGLLPFEAEDRDRFFGRERVVADVVARLGRGGLVTVVGNSGSGKSSLLRAGVAPLFEGSRVIRPAEGDADALLANELLLVDQFEELFTAVPEAERVPFIDRLLARDIPSVVAIRADFYGRCSEYPALAAAVADNQVLLGPMGEHDLRRAITGPAEAAGLAVEPALVDLLVEEVAGEPGALPMLSHALGMTWLNRDGRTLSLAAYRATGGLRRAIAASSDEFLARLPTDEQALLRTILLRLVEPGEDRVDTRRRARIDELHLANVDAARVERVLTALARARLVTLEEDTVEISHEALIREWPQLRAWLDEDRDRLRIRRHLRTAAAAWIELDRDPAELYRGPRLAAVLDALGDDPEASELEREFLDTSQFDAERVLANERRARRRLRRLLAGVAAALVVALVAGGLAVRQSQRAGDESDRAQTAAEVADIRRLVAEVRNLRQTNRDLALLLALEANKMADTPETRGAMQAALLGDPRLTGLLQSSAANYRAAFDPEGSVLALGATDGTVELWNVDRRTRVVPPQSVPGPVVGLWVDRDGSALVASGDGTVRRLRRDNTGGIAAPESVIAVGAEILGADRSSDSTMLATMAAGGGTQVWDLASGQPSGPPIPSARGLLGGVRFDPSGTTLATSGGDAAAGVLQLWDRITGAPRGLPLAASTGGRGVVNVAFSPDGQRLAGAAADGSLTVFDVASGTAIQRLVGGHRDPFVYSVAFSPDGTRLVSVGQDGLAVLWDLATGEPVGDPLDGQAGPTHAIAFRPGTNTFVTAGVDGSAALWDPNATGVLSRRLTTPPDVGCALRTRWTPARGEEHGRCTTPRLWHGQAAPSHASGARLRSHGVQSVGQPARGERRLR